MSGTNVSWLKLHTVQCLWWLVCEYITVVFAHCLILSIFVACVSESEMWASERLTIYILVVLILYGNWWFQEDNISPKNWIFCLHLLIISLVFFFICITFFVVRKTRSDVFMNVFSKQWGCWALGKKNHHSYNNLCSKVFGSHTTALHSSILISFSCTYSNLLPEGMCQIWPHWHT